MTKKPPERIYGWLNSQLSLARFYGGITYNGHSYLIAPNEEGQPLVRQDVLTRERKAKAQADKSRAKKAKEAQAPLFAEGGK